MNRLMAGLVSLTVSFAAVAPAVATAADAPKDRVVVMYFHRTERCPTCKKMGSYAEETVKSEFKKQLKEGSVEFHFIDFELKKNERISKGYRVEEPALIVSKIKDNKVAKFTNLEDIWGKVGEKPAFMKYVRDSVATHSK